MVARSSYRGHQIWFDEGINEWRYEDDNSLVTEHWKNRDCGKCGALFTKDGHDPCIANLPGVKNACCGHGDNQLAYVQFNCGKIISGSEALDYFKDHK